MAFYFSLLSISEEMDFHLREIDKLYRKYNSALYTDEKKEIEKVINTHLDEILKHKDKVLKKVDKEIRKMEKKATRLEKKIVKAERKNRDERELRKKLRYAVEEIDVLKNEAVEHIPESLLSLAFIKDSLQAGGDYFTVDMKNFIGDLYFVRGPKRRKYDRMKINTAELYVNGELCKNFDIIYKGKAYMPYALEGLKIKKNSVFSLRVYEKFFEGIRLRFVIDTENFGVLSFETALTSIPDTLIV